MRAHLRGTALAEHSLWGRFVFSSGKIWARSGHGRLGSKQTSRFGAVKSTASDRVSSSEIVRRHFFLQGKDFLPRLRNPHRQLTSSVSASTSAVGIPLEDLDYVRTIRPWQNKNSKRPNRMHSGRRSWVGLVDMGLDDIASVPWGTKRYQICNIQRVWFSNCSVRSQGEIVNLII